MTTAVKTNLRNPEKPKRPKRKTRVAVLARELAQFVLDNGGAELLRDDPFPPNTTLDDVMAAQKAQKIIDLTDEK